MRHRTTPRFWEHYRSLPDKVRELADKNFQLLQRETRHPSLQFKKVDKVCSVRVGLAHRATLLPPMLPVSCAFRLQPVARCAFCNFTLHISLRL